MSYLQDDRTSAAEVPTDADTKEAVCERDGYCCFWCGAPGGHVHEIISKRFTSHVKYPEKYPWLFEMRNRCLLCDYPCHTYASGHRGELLAKMQDKFGYEYPEPIFQGYL